MSEPTNDAVIEEIRKLRAALADELNNLGVPRRWHTCHACGQKISHTRESYPWYSPGHETPAGYCEACHQQLPEEETT